MHGTHILLASFVSPPVLYFSLVLYLFLHKLCSLIVKGRERHMTHNFHSILFYFLDLTWPVRWLECVAMGMGGAWVEERETTLRSGQNCHPPGPQDSGARQHDSWPMGYLTEEETVQFLHGDMAPIVASSHASSCSVKALHQKYPRYFRGIEIFRDTFQFVLKVRPKAVLWCTILKSKTRHSESIMKHAWFPAELQNM